MMGSARIIRLPGAKGGSEAGFARSKGSFTTKIHLCVTADGFPVCAEITGGEVSDYKGLDLMMRTPRGFHAS
jgi:hypothetical protein